ncbi:MAG TPA: LuxR C-terminal-related transcriptional regulator [Candidatus Nitrosotalea sp.]|nr:LuxR C-terminal-related transcriptional regulator [Candidatus Nitrosotalea sp.]
MTTPNNLPAQLSSFVGRERQLAELRRLLRKSRLITLTGPGGAGKTRLALRLAGEVLDRHPDGVWLVDLGKLNDPRLLEQTVALACGAREEGRRPMLEVLVEHLRAHRSLLILDGCEHLVDPCAALVGSLLGSCPNLTLVVTSREPLGVPGEVIWRTPSLSLPGPEDGAHPELVLESEAVRLYVDRARLSQPDFDLAATGSAAAVAQICTRLEGMPLAIELAASLTRVMTAQEILERLRDRFRLLTGGSRSALPRHQTLRQTVDWSFGLLSAAEKALLARLSIFTGGFDLPAAEAVAQEEPLDAGGVLPVLSRLVDKSLVTAEPVGSKRTRYRMPDTIREYALEKLQHGDEAEARRLMAAYYVDYCNRAAMQLRGSDPLLWLGRLDEEQANIRLALGWTLIEQPDSALRLAAAMGIYWHMRRHFAEAAEWLDQTLELPTASLEARAAALWIRARIRWRQGEYAGAKRNAQESADLCRSLDMPFELCGALTVLGLVAAAVGDYVSAEGYHEEALELARGLNDREAVARSLNNLGLIASARGDHQRGRTLLEEAVGEHRLAGTLVSTAGILDSLARINLLLGDNNAARSRYVEALEAAMRFGDTLYLAECLEGIALLALTEDDAGRTLTLMGAASVIRKGVAVLAMPDWKAHIDQGLATARARLEPARADAAWKQGASMSVQEAITYASGATPLPTRVDGNPLTDRETQVAALIAEGMTNFEIAQRLHIAARTADAHVEHIRNKLGLRSRSQIAVWAHERLGRT